MTNCSVEVQQSSESVDGLRDDDEFCMKAPPVEFCDPVSREPVPGKRLMRASAFERILQLDILSVALVLAVGAWACSSKPRVEGAVVRPNIGRIARGPISVTPTATPSATPSQ